MKIDDNLNNIFDLEPVHVEESNVPMVVPEDESVEKKEADFDLARDTMRDLLQKNGTVLDDLVNLARSSESPRAFEVVGQLVKAQSDMAKDLLNLHKQKKDVDGDSGDKNNIRTQNNIVFAGSTSDLLKMISAERAKEIESK